LELLAKRFGVDPGDAEKAIEAGVSRTSVIRLQIERITVKAHRL
jgi:hypothetical protein